MKRIYLLIRTHKISTRILGPKYFKNPNKIEIAITYLCNKKCIQCDMSCFQAPSNEHMTLDQIDRFLQESINKSIKWQEIKIMGGEPTLHPNFFIILEKFLNYKYKYNNNMILRIITNTYGKKVNSILDEVNNRYPNEFVIKKSYVENPIKVFRPFNVAPRDKLLWKNSNFTNGCWVLRDCGMGFTPSGFYPCLIAGGIDRIIGRNLGRREIPAIDDYMFK